MNKLFLVFFSILLLITSQANARYSYTWGKSTGGGKCHFVCTEWEKDANGNNVNTTFEEWDADCDSVPGADVYNIRKFAVFTEVINGQPVAVGLQLTTCVDNDHFDDNGDICSEMLTEAEIQEMLQIINDAFATQPQ